MQGLEAQCAEVEVRRFVLDLVLVLPLLLGHVLDVEDGPPLGVVETGRPVEHPQEEQHHEHGGHGLKAKSPAQVTKEIRMRRFVTQWRTH